MVMSVGGGVGAGSSSTYNDGLFHSLPRYRPRQHREHTAKRQHHLYVHLYQSLDTKWSTVARTYKGHSSPLNPADPAMT